MTTGRINQVAFLRDATTRTVPHIQKTRGRETGMEVVLIEHKALGRGFSRQGWRTLHRHRILHPKARAVAHGPIRRKTARLAHERRWLGLPCASEEAQGREGQLHVRFSTTEGMQHRNPSPPQAPAGVGQKMIWATSQQFGAPARSLPAQTRPKTAHAPPRTRDIDHDERTTGPTE